MAKAKEDKNETQDTSDASKSLMRTLLDKKKHDHYQDIESLHTHVSSGSLFLDAEIKITEGVHRFCGPAGAGKTSEAANICKIFLEQEKRGKVLWIKAEGRLSENIQKRSGVRFVYKTEEWDYGTAFVLESNTFEFICEVVTNFVNTFRVNDERLLIVIDSVDGLKLKSDKNNELGKERTAGPQLIMKRFLKDMYYPIIKNGVICICISQVVSTISKDDYAPPALVSGGGGNALLHWSNYILEFGARYHGDNILKNPNIAFNQDTNPSVGHHVRITIKKSDKENENKRVTYPIKHGREDGKSIWVEHEIITFAKKWGMIEGTTWLTFDDEIIKDVKEKLKFDLQAKHNGSNNLIAYLEDNPKLTDYLFNRIRTVEAK